MARNPLPYKKNKKYLISFLVDQELYDRIKNILEKSSHEDKSQLMRYILKQYLPEIEKEIDKENNKGMFP